MLYIMESKLQLKGHLCAYTPGAAINPQVFTKIFIKDIVYTSVNAAIFINYLINDEINRIICVIFTRVTIINIPFIRQSCSQRIFFCISPA